ncbi:MAG: carboxypeptidase-like regulatory domain-containing protein [Polyangiales bacterium]
MRDRTLTLALAIALSPAIARAQDASPQATDAAVAAPPGPVDPNAPLPAGHPPMHGGHGTAGQGPDLHRAEMPQTFAEERMDVPPRTVRVRVVSAEGAPQAGVEVRLGAMRDGERDTPQTARTDANGETTFTGLETGSVAYRVSVESEGAKFGAMPFQLTNAAGYRVQVVRHAVSHDARGVLIWDARVESRFRDERLMIGVRMRLANLSAMSLGGDRPRPFTYVPTDGLRFTLPEGATAFNAPASMDDVRLTMEGRDVIFRGSVAPTVDQPTEVTFQFQVKLHGGDVDLALALPLPVVNVGVATEAPAGLGLSVDGFPAAIERNVDGQRVLVTTLSRQPGDAPVNAIRWRLTGIPRAAGPMRTVASLLAAAVVFGGVASAVARRKRAEGRRSADEVASERQRVLAEFEALVALRRDGEVGPLTYERRRRELARWLAALMREADDASARS